MEAQQVIAGSNAASSFFLQLRNPLKFRLFLLRSLPAAFFSGVRMVSASEGVCSVSVPFKWFTKNPFRSTYFACLSMAAELSTGVLAMAQIVGQKPAVSMLVTGMESKFHKKATGLTLFTCSDGFQLKQVINQARETGAPQLVRVQAIGRNEKGELVAEFWFEWSFKVKQ